MVRVDETQQGAHDFTVGWWRELPEAHRLADRAQGEVLAPAWDGLNRDPRFVTGFDGWDRTNTSKLPYVASLSLTRTFKVTPNVPVLVRSWHTPLIMGTEVVARVRVRHTIRDYTNRVIQDETFMVDRAHGTADTWVTPDRFGSITVVVDVSLEVDGKDIFGYSVTEKGGHYHLINTNITESPTTTGLYHGGDGKVVLTEVETGRYQLAIEDDGGTGQSNMDTVAAIHVGTRAVDFEELPDLAAFTTLKPYPLLRFMDGIGHLAGFLDDELAHMWEGHTFDPVTAPDEWLRFLATMLGIPRRYLSQLTLPQLRSHLVAFMQQGRPPIGSRRAIAEIAKQWLTGDKQVTVIPASSAPTWNSPPDEALLTAVKNGAAKGRVIVSDTPPQPGVEHRWEGAKDSSRSTRWARGQFTAENILPNPKFRQGINGWSAARADIQRDTTQFETSPASLKVAPTDTGWSVGAEDRWVAPESGTVTVRFRVHSVEARRLAPRLIGEGGTESVYGSSTDITAGTWATVSSDIPVVKGGTYRVSLSPFSNDPWLTPLWVDRAYFARTTYSVGEYFDGDTPDSSANDVWVQPGTPKVYVWEAAQRWVLAVGDFAAAATAVIEAQQQSRTHTLLMLVRADELPGRDLEAFQRFMMGTGTIPAGHDLVCLEAKNTWEQWEDAVGPTWNDLESRTRTWTDMEAAGVALDY